MIMVTGQCRDCPEVLTATHRGHLPARCPDCKRQHTAARMSEWRASNPEAAKAIRRRHQTKRQADPLYRQRKRDREARRLYGIEPADLRALEEKQAHRCAICRGEHVGSGNSLHIDHDHATGQVRGLLCGKCNTLIGLAGDDPAVLKEAIEYLLRGGA